MDIKNPFWGGVAGVGGALLLGLLYTIFMVDPGVTKAARDISRSVKKVKTLAKENVASTGDIDKVSKHRLTLARDLTRSMVYLAARDESTFERRILKDGNPMPRTLLVPFYSTQQTKIKRALQESEGAYAGLTIGENLDAGGNPIQAIAWPNPPVSDDQVAGFYRQYWLIRTMLDEVVAPLAKEKIGVLSPAEQIDARWQLVNLKMVEKPGDVRLPPVTDEGYVQKIYYTQVQLKMQLQHLSALVQRLSNLPFFAFPAAVNVRMDEQDPKEIELIVPPGVEQPNDQKKEEMASRKRPKVLVTLVLAAIDLDQEKVLALCRAHAGLVGDRDALQTWLTTELDKDEFLTPYKPGFGEPGEAGGFDRTKFLATMVDRLKKPAE